MTVLTGQPYPDARAWQDLTPYLVNGWARRGTVALGFQVDGNNVKVSAGLLFGTERVIAEGLPELVNSERPIMAFAQGPNGARPINVNLNHRGVLEIGPAVWEQLGAFGALIIGGEVPR